MKYLPIEKRLRLRHLLLEKKLNDDLPSYQKMTDPQVDSLALSIIQTALSITTKKKDTDDTSKSTPSSDNIPSQISEKSIPINLKGKLISHLKLTMRS